VAVVRKFLDDRASNLTALIAYYAFFSLFALLLALVSALGFVLQDNPSLQDDVLDSALARIPGIGAQLRDGIEPLAGSEIALVVGLAGALWAGLGIGLLSWFWLFSHLLLLAAEVNVVLRRRLWPRSLTGELEAADRSALQRTAEAMRQDERQEILVRFSDDHEPGQT
jgi:uncharacterized BrkB/YihY/UPF0761 family membrane protein